MKKVKEYVQRSESEGAKRNQRDGKGGRAAACDCERLKETSADCRKGRVKNGQFKNMLFVQGGENLRQLCDGIFRRVHGKHENLHTR